MTIDAPELQAGSASFERQGNLGLITVDNPPANLFTSGVMEGLAEAVDEAAGSDVRALVVRAAGPNFTGGAHVKLFEDTSAAEARRVFSRFIPVIHQLEDLPFPTVCQVQGLCLAAGLEVALACDLIFAADSAVFAQVEASIGTATLLGGAQRLAERAGSARAREICFTADFYDAASFERWNIVNRVWPADQLEERTTEFAQRLADGPTKAHAVTKRLLRSWQDEGVAQADRLLLDVATPLFDTEDMQGGVKTLLAVGARRVKEEAKFTGR